MKKITAILALSAVLALPSLAQAKQVTLTTELNGYQGDGAYVAIYLTDANGSYQETLWVAGGKAKYYKHLRDWARGSGLKASEYDGKTGASLASSKTLITTIEVPDNWLDAGYQLRIDTAVEDLRENRAEVIVPFTSTDAGQTTLGKGYVKSFTYQLP